jgi:diguanylate cyclase (GGDEF)-like protein
MHKPPLILVVDDTPTDALLLSKALSKAGYDVVVAYNGDTCLQLAAERKPDFVLLDITMPGRDGLETCRLLKSQPETASIPVVFVTVHSDSEHIVQAFAAGGSDYVTKPLRIDEILARISVQLRLCEAEQNLVERNGQMKKLMDQLTETNAELALQARVDTLTQLLNRNTWEQVAEAEHERSIRHKHEYSILMLDVDFFKMLNDSQGHQAGDDSLRSLAGAIASSCRKSDIVGRYGGEEFVVLAPETRYETAIVLAERIRQNIWNLAIMHPANPAGRVTISIGVAELDNGSLTEAIREADKTLYLAKRSGRNIVCGHHVAVPSIHPLAGEASAIASPPATAIDFDRRAVVLVVEDNATNSRLYRGCLAKEDYRIIEAKDGNAGLAAVTRDPPDVIIMDVLMPEMDGLECTRRIKANPQTCDIPLIIASACNNAADILAGLKAGADEYLTKPFRTTELTVRVRSMVRLSRERKEVLRSNQLRAEQSRVLAMLLDFCPAIGSAATSDKILEHLIYAIADLTGCRRISVMLPDPARQYLTIAKCIGMEPEAQSRVRVRIGSAISGKVFETRRPIVVNSEKDALNWRDEDESEFFTGVPLLSAPLGTDPEVLGVLNVTDRVGGNPFEPRELEYVELIASIAGSALHGMRDRQARDDARDLIVVALAKLAEHRDNDTARHVERVTQYAIILADALRSKRSIGEQIDDRFIHDLQRAVPLHDIGNVAIPESILRKPGRLTAQEMAIVRTHTDIGVDALRPVMEKAANIGFLSMASDIIHGHHEWYDGSGYPRGLTGNAIPLAARIVAIVDVYDAITTDRVYKRAISHDEGEAIIVNSSGSQFDPAIVEAFLECKEAIRLKAQELADMPARLDSPEAKERIRPALLRNEPVSPAHSRS